MAYRLDWSTSCSVVLHTRSCHSTSCRCMDPRDWARNLNETNENQRSLPRLTTLVGVLLTPNKPQIGTPPVHKPKGGLSHGAWATTGPFVQAGRNVFSNRWAALWPLNATGTRRRAVPVGSKAARGPIHGTSTENIASRSRGKGGSERGALRSSSQVQIQGELHPKGGPYRKGGP